MTSQRAVLIPAIVRWVATRNWSAIAERLVLALVLGIAALISYTHQREVWQLSGAPWDALGPLLLDALFAAAWLRMRRRRAAGEPVGWLAWLALAIALTGTLAGNLAAPWFTGHRDPLAMVVAAVPAIAFALVWELVAGHSRPVRPASPVQQATVTREAAPVAPAPAVPPAAAPVFLPPAPKPAVDEPVRLHFAPTDADEDETVEDKARRLLAAGAGRPTLMRELGIEDSPARRLLKSPDRVDQILAGAKARTP